MRLIHELHRRQGVLKFANKLLILAMVLQLPFIFIAIARTSHPDWTMSNKVYWMLSLTSSIMAIVGFTVVCRQLGLWADALENSNVPALVQKTRLLGSAKISAGVQLMFFGAFLIPMLNLPAILWAKVKATSAIRDLEELKKASRR